ncbi:conjugative transposon protein TraJ [Pedobacter psychrophilus]|uniref:Conjugative transposon protein TraJ n=1 Tax=Pedobacter psychrophilus TaxID=1826909 RepID=A0A179DN00_9SPHI|nr:conjugative transposon protein TraJ [Pedobacter psychrophilus]OAQ42397.1 conjugative transposon protein TraJ [Pedobacter psychrophilus]
MKNFLKLFLVLFSMLIFLNPDTLMAQDMNSGASGLHLILDQLYQEMMPLCSKLIGVSQGIAGFATIWYIGSRVWRHIANAEPVDFYPLLRPFVLGFAILIFPQVLNLLNGILQPTVNATSAMVQDSNKSIELLLKEKEKMVKNSESYQMYIGSEGDGNRDKWYKYTYDDDPANEGMMAGLGNDFKFSMAKLSYNFRNSIKQWMSEVLKVIFEAAVLCINTLRTFNLVVLSILGPFVFGIAVFDGFQHTLTSWLARYINTFLWLPVANIFGSIIGKIQEKMLTLDIGQISQNSDTFFSSTDTAYLVFMIIAIVGYFTVPTVAGYIVSAGGGGAMVQKVTQLLSTSSTGVASAVGSRMSQGAGNVMNAGGQFAEGYRSAGSANDISSKAGSHLSGKLSN